MRYENLATRYGIFTEDVAPGCPDNQNYVEIHTGAAWEGACDIFCGSNGEHTSLALIVVWGQDTYQFIWNVIWYSHYILSCAIQSCSQKQS